MKKLYYDEGPAMESFGDAGQFRLGEPKDVQDDLADILIRKGRLKEFTETTSDTVPGKGKRGKEE